MAAEALEVAADAREGSKDNESLEGVHNVLMCPHQYLDTYFWIFLLHSYSSTWLLPAEASSCLRSRKRCRDVVVEQKPEATMTQFDANDRMTISSLFMYL
jgi:hypothetical protein